MNYQKGIKLSLLTAIFSGFAIFFNGYVVKAVGDPLVFTTLKNLGVALIVGLILFYRMKNNQLKWRQIQKKDWFKLIAIGIIGGSLPFYLFFKGLSIAESARAALIHKTLIFWVALWAVPFLKEKISLKQLSALGLIFAGNLIIGGLGKFHWGVGEWMILAATILWGIENIIAKIALKDLQAYLVVGARMILGSILLFSATITTGKMNLIFNLGLAQWGLTLITVAFLSGYVLTWYRALKLAPATSVATVLTLGAIITNILSAIFVTHTFKTEAFYQAVFLISGVWFFLKTARKINQDSFQPELGLS